DLSVTLGTPNACNNCHTNRDARWAAARIETWFGHDPNGYQHFGPAFSLAHAGSRDRQAELGAVANDTTQPAIARATALAQLEISSNPAAIETLAHNLRDPSGIVRLGALQSLLSAPLDLRMQLATPSLSDPLRAVRVEAASVLAPVPSSQLTADARL